MPAMRHNLTNLRKSSSHSSLFSLLVAPPDFIVFIHVLGDLRFTNLSYPVFKLEDLKIPLDVSLDKDDDVMNTGHSWKSMPSSY